MTVRRIYFLQMVATICMFIAGKVEETPRPLRDVIWLSYENRFKKDPAAVQRIKQKVFTLNLGVTSMDYRLAFLKNWLSLFHKKVACLTDGWKITTFSVHSQF